jgi:hypothetical protein
MNMLLKTATMIVKNITAICPAAWSISGVMGWHMTLHPVLAVAAVVGSRLHDGRPLDDGLHGPLRKL